MPLMLGINVGFITNSSSVVYHFPKELLEDPKIKAFITAFDVQGGFVGSNMWGRDTCATIAMTKEQKQEAQKQLHAEGYADYGGIPSVGVEDDASFVLIYGDEFPSVVSSLATLLKELAEKLGISVYCTDYN